jgi:hypothetical protein
MEGKKSFLEKILPRVLKATLMGFIAFFIYYLLPTFLLSMLPTESFPSEFGPYFSRYEGLVYVFAAVMICFAVAIQLSSGSILKHALSTAKVIVLIVLFIYTLDGGFLALNISMEGMVIGVVADLSTLLAILIAIDLLGFAKNLFEAIDFLSRKAVLRSPNSS